VELQRGSGVFVRRSGAATLGEAHGLDEMIRLALRNAFAHGFSGVEVRGAVERWLAAAPPDRVLVVDPSVEMAELLAHEIGAALGVPTSGCALSAFAADPARAAGAMIVLLPYHVEAVRSAVPGAAIEVVNLQIAAADRAAIEEVPAGSIVLVVSHAPTVLPFASVFLRSLRGDDVIAESRLLSAPGEWKRLIKAADLVLADAVAAPVVRKAGPRRLREVKVIPETAIARLRKALTAVVPQPPPRAPGRRRSNPTG
jgi:hypothetical protein